MFRLLLTEPLSGSVGMASPTAGVRLIITSHLACSGSGVGYAEPGIGGSQSLFMMSSAS